MKFTKQPGASVATTVDGYKINISGFGVVTYTSRHTATRQELGKFHDSEPAKQACVKHFEANK